MAIKISGTDVISGSRELKNISGLDTTTKTTFESVLDINPFAYNAVSGATQSLDVGSFNFFDAGTLTEDTTISFANVPSEASWTYTANAGASSYSLTSARYDDVNFSVNSEEFAPSGVFFKPDGTKMYIIGTGNGTVYQYTLSPAWDLSSASYDSVSLNVEAQAAVPTGVFFKPDGTKMYVIGTVSDSVHQYTLSTAWDLSSASYDSVSFSVKTQDGAPREVFFKPDGTKMYFLGIGTASAHQYTLSTAWDLSSASYDSVSFSVGSQEVTPEGFFFKPDGTQMYVVGTDTDSIHQYTLSTAWDLSSASYDSVSFSVASQETAPTAVFFKSDGAKMYVVGSGNDRVNQYSTATGFTITLPSSVESPLSISTEAGELVVYTFFTSNSGSTVYLQATNRTGSLIDDHLDTSSAASGQVLIWDGKGYVWGSGGATSLDGLSDAKANSYGGIGIGTGALAASNSAFRNVALGRDALSSIADYQSDNTAIGDQAGDSLATGSGNVVIGASSDLTTGISDTVTIGYQAFSTGRNAIAIGQSAYANERTVAMGRGQFSSFGFAEDSVFIGDYAGKDKTGSYNIGIGHQAGQSTGNGTGTDGIAIGRSARSGTSGSFNVSLGYRAGLDITTGEDNVAIGREAGTNLTTGLDNVLIGSRAAPFLTTGSNNIVLGDAEASSGTVSNEITLGNSSISTLRCQVTTITSLSDARDKTDIQPLNAGLEFVEALNPVSFNWNMRDGGKVGVADTGFIAQDLQAAQTDTGVTIPDLVYDVNPDKLEAGYGKLIPVLVQAIKDLSAEVKDLKAQLEAK